MHTVEIRVPDGLAVDDEDLVWRLAALLHNQGKASLGQAAEIVGVSKRAFMETMGRYGGIAFSASAEEIDRDVRNG